MSVIRAQFNINKRTLAASIKTNSPSTSSPFTSIMFFSTAKSDSSHGKLSILTINKQDVPPMSLKWYFATNNAVRYPEEYGEMTDTNEELTKFNEFKEEDSIRLEEKYRELIKLKEDPSFKKESNKFKVEVNEDHLFEVDLNQMQMNSIYWSGATYAVRRGTWFTIDGIPLSSKISEELEEGYLKIRPFDLKPVIESTKESNPLKKMEIIATDESTLHEFKSEYKEGDTVLFDNTKFGYIFKRSNTGSLQFANMFKNLEINNPGMDFIKVVRGFKDNTSTPIITTDKNATSSSPGPDLSSLFQMELTQLFGSNLFGKSDSTSKKDENEATKTAMELEITKDYNNNDDPKISNKRKINHLVLCVHGIGQILGSKFEAVNFIHTVNILRKNIKKVHKTNISKANSKDEIEQDSGIQVLPIVWRHKVNFKQDSHSVDRLPSLAQITVDEIKPMRNLIGAVLLDILLYYEPFYLKQILEEVTDQANFIVNEFKQRNPDFDGKISIIGHSLGSVIVFDLLSAQYPDNVIEHDESKDLLQFTFPVQNYFAIGSPIAVFNLLKRKGISGRDDPTVKDYEVLNQLTSQPKCETFYNIFHPCDPVAYKLEPLITPSLSYLKPASLELDSITTDLNKTLNSFSEKLETLKWDYPKEVTKTATNISKLMTDKTEGVVKLLKMTNAETKKESDLENENIEEKKDAQKKDIKKDATYKLTEEQLIRLTSLNYKGRIDYAVEQGLFDFSVFSAISAHVSYFEDETTAAFVLKEILSKEKKPVTELKVSTVGDKSE